MLSLSDDVKTFAFTIFRMPGYRRSYCLPAKVHRKLLIHFAPCRAFLTVILVLSLQRACNNWNVPGHLGRYKIAVWSRLSMGRDDDDVVTNHDGTLQYCRVPAAQTRPERN